MRITTLEPIADQFGNIWPTGTIAIELDGWTLGSHPNTKDFRVVDNGDRDHILWSLVPIQYQETN